MTLLQRIAGILRGADIPHALIGASAMAVHGVVRSTLDQDLLAVDPSCLQPEGVVRFSSAGQDAWDIQQLLAAEDRETLIAQVDEELAELPAESALLWRKILE